MIPTAAELREKTLRRKRSLDVSEVLLYMFVVGGLLTDAVRRLASTPAATETVIVWLTVAAALVITGLALRLVVLIGPIVAGPAMLTWLLSTPVNRHGLLAKRFRWSLCAATATGFALGAITGRAAGADVLATAVTGALSFAALLAFAVVSQAHHQDRRALSFAAALSISAFAVAVIVIATGSAPVLPLNTTVLAGVAGLFAIVGAWWAERSLNGLDSASLAGGAELTGAAALATTMIDPSLLSGVLVARRWKRVGRVRSQRLTGDRARVLLRAELVRLRRSRTALLIWAALLAVPYGVAVVLPAFVSAAQLLGAYIVTDRFAGGLRAVCQSPALRRTLGGTDRELRLAHLVIPFAAGLLWWLATLPALLDLSTLTWLIVPLGAVAVVYRTATKPPMNYDVPLVDTPFGLLPAGLIQQVLRGPALLTVLILVV